MPAGPERKGRPQISSAQRRPKSSCGSKSLPKLASAKGLVCTEAAHPGAPPAGDCCSAWECPICRDLLNAYAAGMVKPSGQMSPFDRLVAQDFIPPAELDGGAKFCFFHTSAKRRYDILKFITKGLKNNVRYEALYNELAVMSKQAASGLDQEVQNLSKFSS